MKVAAHVVFASVFDYQEDTSDEESSSKEGGGVAEKSHGKNGKIGFVQHGTPCK